MKFFGKWLGSSNLGKHRLHWEVNTTPDHSTNTMFPYFVAQFQQLHPNLFLKWLPNQSTGLLLLFVLAFGEFHFYIVNFTFNLVPVVLYDETVSLQVL